MNIHYQRDHVIIKRIVLLLLLLFSYSIAVCNNDMNVSVRNSEVPSFTAEQKFWKHWISTNDDNTCPLQPFILSYTKKEIELLDEEIQRLNKTDSAILFVRVNIDNGIFFTSYLTWNDADEFINSLEWYGPGNKINKLKLENKQYKIIQSLNEIIKHSIFVDIKDRTVIDGDSFYISLWHKGYFSRVALYNPKFNAKKIEKSEIPFLLLKQLEKTLVSDPKDKR